MQTILCSLLVLLFSSVGLSQDTPLPISRDAFGLGLPQGTGQDMERIEVLSTHENFRNVHYIRFSISANRIDSFDLPRFKMLQKCEFRRSNGGSAGDYKPKGMIFKLDGLLAGTLRLNLWQTGDRNTDYNENPVSREFGFTPQNFQLPPRIAASFRGYCLQSGGPKFVILEYKSEGLCRWKPENWHKPGHFPFEYRPTLDAQVRAGVYLECVP